MRYRIIGFGLLETVLAIAVIAGIVMLSIRYYQSTSNQQKINQTIIKMQQITSSMSNALSTTNTGNNLMATLWSNKANLNETMINKKLVNPSTLLSSWATESMKVSMEANSTAFGSSKSACCEKDQSSNYCTPRNCTVLKIQIPHINANSLNMLQTTFCSKFQTNYPNYRGSTFSVCLQ